MNNPSIGKAFEYFLEYSPDLVEVALTEFVGDSYTPQESELSEEQVQSFFGSYFMFDYRLPETNETPLERYLDQEKENLIAEETRYYQALLKSNRFSVFEILHIELGHSLRVRDIVHGKEYDLSEHRGTYDLQVGQPLICRIWYTGAVWQLAPDILPYPVDALPMFLDLAHKITKKDPITPKIIWQVFTEPVIHSVSEGKRALEVFLRDHEADPSIDANKVIKWLKETKKISTTIDRVLAYMRLEQEEADELMTIVNLIWNQLSVADRGGDSDMPSNWKPGKVERRLIARLHEEAMKAIDPHEYISTIDLNNDLKQFQEKWIDTPLPNEENATPRQLVARERELYGHPIKDWTVDIMIERWGDAKEGRASALLNAGIEAHNQGKLFEAEDFYRQYINENDEPYQAWGNLGLVLAAQGRKSEAIQALEKAIEIQPDYQLARNNLERTKNATDADLVQFKTVVGAGLLRVGIKEKAFTELSPVLASLQVKETRALQDSIAIMRYLVEKNGVRLTAAKKEFPISVIRELNTRLVVSDPEDVHVVVPNGKSAVFQNNSQAQFPTINLLYRTFLATGLLRIQKGKYVPTELGRKFIEQSAIEQYITILWGYLAELDWGKHARGEVMAEFRSRVDGIVQQMLPERFSSLLELAEGQGDWIDYAKLQKTIGKETETSDDNDGFGATMLLSLTEERILWLPLEWFGLVELKQSKDVQLTMSLIVKIRPSELGNIILPSLAIQHHSNQPIHSHKIGRNEPCPCGSGKKYKKCCLNKTGLR